MDELIGKKIVRVRPMTNRELEREGWTLTMHGRPPVLVLDDGTTIYPSQDEEGNHYGALVGVDARGGSFQINIHTGGKDNA